MISNAISQMIFQHFPKMLTFVDNKQVEFSISYIISHLMRTLINILFFNYLNLPDLEKPRGTIRPIDARRNT